MIHLLDVNALLALGFEAHEHHARLAGWVSRLPTGDSLATCPITEIGFVRVLQQAPQFRVPISDGRDCLARLRANRVRPFVFIPDHQGAEDLPAWVKSGRQTTDGHLLSLAVAHGARLVTLDAGIPGAVMVP